MTSVAGGTESPDEPFVHPTAIVEPGARLGAGVRVWHHVHIRAGAVVGEGTSLGKNVYVDAGVVVGARVKVQNNVSLYAGVTLEDEVFVGPSAVFTNDLFPRAVGGWEVVPTVLREGASVGANATIICGRDIGRRAMVGAGSVVTRAVLDHELVVGNPARRAGWVCTCGRPVASGDVEPPPPSLNCPACGQPWRRSS